MTFGLFLILCSLILFIYAILFERYKKGNKKEYIYNFIILIAMSGILFAMAMPSSFHNNSNKLLKSCYRGQERLVYAIEKYNSDNQDNLFPENCNDSEIEKYQKELLLNNKYLKEQVYLTRYCSLEIKDSELFCIEHGSCNPKSKYYTDGHPVEGYTNNKVDESVRNQFKEIENKKKERYYSLIVAFIGLVAALKFFIFIIL